MMQKKQEIQQKSRLGSLLIEKGMITSQQLDEALRLQNVNGKRLGEVLIDQGWITERQLNRSLKKQTRYRHIAALTAILLGPIQPFLANANVEQDAVNIEEVVENRSQIQADSFGLKAMSDDDMGQVVAQGVSANVQDILDSALDTTDNGESTLGTLGNLLMPGTNLLDSEMEMSGVTYAEGPRTTLNEDGSIEVALPTHIEKIAFKNVNVQGSSGPAMGDIMIKDIDLSNVNVTIRLHN